MDCYLQCEHAGSGRGPRSTRRTATSQVREPQTLYQIAPQPETPQVIDFAADAEIVRTVVEGERLTYGYLFNPAFATEISLIDPLPHQRIAVYDHMLKQSRLRFLLANGAGAGKTIMTGLYIREMLSRRFISRVLIVPPAGLAGNWERELRTLFNLPFRIVSGNEARSGNPFTGPRGDLLIASVDTLAGERMFARLQIDAFNAYPSEARRQHFLRRTKEELVDFGGDQLYPQRISDTLSYSLTQGEESEQLEKLIDDMRAGRLTQAQLQALQRSLDEVKDTLDVTTAYEEDVVNGEEAHEVSEDELLGSVLATSLADLARRVDDAGEESKFEKLQEVLRDPRYQHEKPVIFTEHRDTLEFLVHRLEGMGFTGQIAQLHGGMNYQEREEQVAAFRTPVEEGGALYMVPTDAAGEGINLQVCWLMVNYDIPWNPARLEQHMGRIHRYGQKHDPVVILNLVAGKTREGRLLQTLLMSHQLVCHSKRTSRHIKYFTCTRIGLI